MSDDFDKEAERKRLREKYEREKEDREATERMSELLLKGATMTNHHCDTCGSPIFRYQGQEFCPNCEAERQAAERAGGDGGEAPAEAGTAPATDPAPDEEPAPDATAGGDVDAGSTATPTEQGVGGGPPGPANAPAPPTAPDLDDVSIEAVQASLTRTLATFSKRAAETDDPHRAREYLETAKAAAETLRALPR